MQAPQPRHVGPRHEAHRFDCCMASICSSLSTWPKSTTTKGYIRRKSTKICRTATRLMSRGGDAAAVRAAGLRQDVDSRGVLDHGRGHHLRVQAFPLAADIGHGVLGLDVQQRSEVGRRWIQVDQGDPFRHRFRPVPAREAARFTAAVETPTPPMGENKRDDLSPLAGAIAGPVSRCFKASVNSSRSLPTSRNSCARPASPREPGEPAVPRRQDGHVGNLVRGANGLQGLIQRPLQRTMTRSG